MLGKTLSLVAWGSLAAAALFFAAGPAMSQKGGGGHGGSHGGGGGGAAHVSGGAAHAPSHGPSPGAGAHPSTAGNFRGSNGNRRDFDRNRNFDRNREFDRNRDFARRNRDFGFGPWWGWWGPWGWGGSWYGNDWYYPYDDYAYAGYPNGYSSYYSGQPGYSDDTLQGQPPSGQGYADDNRQRSRVQINENAALIAVRVPADAELWFDGTKTSQASEVRQFQTPALEPGQEYNYTVRARWKDQGREVDQTRKVTVRAGDRLGINFMVPNRNPSPPAP
jgi:uncharacterized protein (TIGR03000 family)